MIFRRRHGRLGPADEHISADAMIALPDVGVALKLADIYEGVDLSQPGAAPSAEP